MTGSRTVKQRVRVQISSQFGLVQGFGCSDVMLTAGT